MKGAGERGGGVVGDGNRKKDQKTEFQSNFEMV